MKQGDVILVDLGPTAGHEQQGYRPAIVVSSDHFNRCGLCTIAPISNTTKGPYRVQLPEEYTAKFGTTGCVLFAHMRTVDIFKRKHKLLGQTNPQFAQRIMQAFEQSCVNA